MTNNLEKIKEHDFNNYKNALIELVNNNTASLVDDDITNIIKKPPLETMDQFKKKLLSVAKKHKTILDTEALNKLLEEYREKLIEEFKFIKEMRAKKIIKEIENHSDEETVFKVTKTFLANINKEIKKKIKCRLNDATKNNLIANLDTLFIEDELEQIKSKTKEEVTKYTRSIYEKQVLEDLELKMIVKDITLINGINEQGERYTFTKNNSRIYDIDK